MSRRPDVRDERGLSLVELLTAIVVLGVVGAFIVGAVVHALASQQTQTARVETLNATKLAFERITRDLRAADPLRVAEPDRVRLDTRTDDGVRTVTYALDEQELVVEEEASAPRGLVNHVVPDEEPTFRFHLVDGTTVTDEPVADPRLVHSITVRLRVAAPDAGRPVELDNRVLLRNQRP